ncbi:MAG: DNA gyrase subunit A, partial [Victivallaceae bacterium]|nr:DNA gyrase subunit A [Victivallaceae bacterium]
ERAAEKNKIKISSVNDYTTDKVEIEIVPTRGYDPEKTIQALYMYTDCSLSISSNITVIRENRPVVMTVTEVIERNTAKLLEYLRAELEIALGKQNELFHMKTLAQIFFENRIYKKIEECRTESDEYREVHQGLAPFREMLRRDVTDEDVDKLLALPVRRISRFDIEKNQKELREIEKKIAQIRHDLKHLKEYAENYLQLLIDKYAKNYPRHTEIEHFEKIDRQAAALNNIKIGWDRKNGYIGTSIRSDDVVTCNEFDHLLEIEKSGVYKVTALPPEKLYVGRLYECRKYDSTTEFGIIYKEKKTGKYYGKRSVIDKYITDREYRLCPDQCQLELLTPRTDAIYQLDVTNKRGTTKSTEMNLMTLPRRSAAARGILMESNSISKITHRRYLSDEELALFRSEEKPEEAPVETAPDPITEPPVEAVSPLEPCSAVEETAPVETSCPVENDVPVAAEKRKSKAKNKAPRESHHTLVAPVAPAPSAPIVPPEPEPVASPSPALPAVAAPAHESKEVSIDSGSEARPEPKSEPKNKIAPEPTDENVAAEAKASPPAQSRLDWKMQKVEVPKPTDENVESEVQTEQEEKAPRPVRKTLIPEVKYKGDESIVQPEFKF